MLEIGGEFELLTSRKVAMAIEASGLRGRRLCAYNTLRLAPFAREIPVYKATLLMRSDLE